MMCTANTSLPIFKNTLPTEFGMNTTQLKLNTYWY